MAGVGSGDADGLIPALPDQLVLAHVVPRLPWHVRPVCRAVSKSWRAWMDTSTKRPDLQLTSREYQLPLLAGCVLIFTFDRCVFIGRGNMPSEERQEAGYPTVQLWNDPYQIGRQWRQLPPLHQFLPPSRYCAGLIASSGMVYIWSLREPESFVLKMDMGCGDWTWNKFPVPRPFNEGAIHFSGKIYVPRDAFRRRGREEMGLVYDMRTDHCELMKTRIHYQLGVLRKNRYCASLHDGEEELCNFVLQMPDEPLSQPPALEILTYDACRDSWTTGDTIYFPLADWTDIGDVQLANGDCFEPVADVGINTLWINHDFGDISWFNPSLHETQVALNTSLEGMCFEQIKVIRGVLYVIFVTDEEGQDHAKEWAKEHYQEEDRSDQQDRKLVKRTLMKGTISVCSKKVNWQEVLDVGIFQLRQSDYIVFPEILDYTLMA